MALYLGTVTGNAANQLPEASKTFVRRGYGHVEILEVREGVVCITVETPKASLYTALGLFKDCFLGVSGMDVSLTQPPS